MIRMRRSVLASLVVATFLFAPQTIAEDAPAKLEKKFAPKALGMDLPSVTSADDLDKYVGRLVAVRGTVTNAKPPLIVGVEVDVSDELRQEQAEAYAVGILAKFTLTEEAYQKIQDRARKSGNLIGVAIPGPGDHYSLHANLDGKLAEAKRLAAGNGK